MNVYMSFKELAAKYPQKLASREDRRMARWVQECLYEKFMGQLETLVDNKYQPWMSAMNLAANWVFDAEAFDGYTLDAKGVSFSVVLETEFLDGFSEYDPLIEFVFDLDQKRFNEAYIKELFQQMDTELGELLKTTYGNWMIATCKYHWELFNHFGEQIEVDNPIMDPERYFLTHETVALD